MRIGRSFAILVLAALMLFPAALTALAQTNIDTSFLGGVNDMEAQVKATARQSDGKILVVGYFQRVNGTSASYIVRLNQDGTRDISFDVGGERVDGDLIDLLVLPDDKILIGGRFNSYDGVPVHGLARLNSDGSLDPTFNAGGSGVGGTVNPYVVEIEPQPDGRFVIAGGSIKSYNGVDRTTIFRILADGSLDTTFSSPFAPNQFSYVEEVEVLPDGKIIVGGDFTDVGGYARPNLARLNSDGSVDPSFDIGSGPSGGVYAMAGQTDGKILIGGYFDDYNGTPVPKFARIDQDGVLDPAFSLPPVSGDDTESIVVQSDGKIVLAGNFNVGGLSDVAAIRLNGDGTIDASFVLSTADSDNLGYHVRLEPTGKIFLAGFFSRFGSEDRFGCARLNSDGSVDPSFQASISGIGLIYTLTRQSDGKILAGGQFRSANGILVNDVARFNPDGSPDETFDTGVGFSSAFTAKRISAISVQPDGKVLVGGYFGKFGGAPADSLTRLNPDGSRDNTFEQISFGGAIVYSLLVLPDGKILAGGVFDLQDPFATVRRSLVRLNPDGSLDTSFATITPNNGVVYGLVSQPDGKIVVAGSFSYFQGQSLHRIVRLNSDGSLDPSFDPGAGANSTIVDALVQPDGKILVSGRFTSFAGIARNGIARLNGDGSLDLTFDQGAGPDGLINSLELQSDGKVLIAGAFSNYGGASHVSLARLNPDGSPDESFSSGFNSTDTFRIPNKLLLQPDGRLLVGGQFVSYDGVPRESLVRVSTAPNTGTFVTGTGTDVSVSEGGIDLTFDSVTGGGETTITSIDPTGTGNEIPDGYFVIEGIAGYEVTTTATLASGSLIEFCVQVPSVNDEQQFNALSLLHGENGVFVDRTYSRSYSTRTICARTSSLSPFVLAMKDPPPTVSIEGPTSGAVFPVGATVSFYGRYEDNSGGHTAQWLIGGETLAGLVDENQQTVSAEKTFSEPGVYLVELTVTDQGGGTGAANTVDGMQAMIVIYDPNGGFVTGGGWIDSPAGAYRAEPDLSGRASFGFVSKYKQGSTVPTGNTEFQFVAAGLRFSSTSYEWLVVSGARAQFKGAGTINGLGEYDFMLTAVDGQTNGGGGFDKFRIRIWDRVSGGLVYDNQVAGDTGDAADPSTLLGGGSVVIHK